MDSNISKYGFQFLQALSCHQAGTEVFDMGQAFQVVGIMTTHFEYAQFFALPFYRAMQVFTTGFNTFGQNRWLQLLTRSQEMLDLTEYPWITNSGPAYHDTIHTITVLVFECFLRTV